MDLIPWLGRYLLIALLYLFLLQAVWAVLADLRVPEPSSPLSIRLPRSTRSGGVLPSEEARGAALEVMASGGSPKPGARFALNGGARMGRHPGCEIHLPDAYVSGEHARLLLRDGQYWIEDLQSTNGTLVNGERVTAPRPLRAGDRITIGPIILRFVRT